MSEHNRPLPVGVWHEEKKPLPEAAAPEKKSEAQPGPVLAQSVPQLPSAQPVPRLPEPQSREEQSAENPQPEEALKADQPEPAPDGPAPGEGEQAGKERSESAAQEEALARAARRAAKSGRQRVQSAGRIRIAAAVIAAGVLIAACALLLQKKESPPPEPSSVPAPSSVSVPEEPEDDPLSPSDPELWSLLLANTEHPLPEGYEPVLANTGNGQYVDARILQPLQDLFAAAEEDGIHLYVRSAYRSEETQAVLFEQLQQEYMAMGYSRSEAYDLAKQLRNLPGTSEHQTGLAVDIVSASNPRVNLVESLAETEWAQWLRENAADYGFILRYPEGKTDITGTSYEPWHYRYVGVEDAQKIMAAGLCLEEYLGVASEEEQAPVSSSASSVSSSGDSSSAAGSPSSSASSASSASHSNSASSNASSHQGEEKA